MERFAKIVNGYNNFQSSLLYEVNLIQVQFLHWKYLFYTEKYVGQGSGAVKFDIHIQNLAWTKRHDFP